MLQCYLYLYAVKVATCTKTDNTKVMHQFTANKLCQYN